MKKIGLCVAVGCLMIAGVSASAQESRQDVSISGIGVIAPTVEGSRGNNSINPTITAGGLISYRFLVTPRSALEVNYSYTQNYDRFTANFLPSGSRAQVHARQQEFSAAYVYSRNYHNFNPFAEVGAGVMLFVPIHDSGTTYFDTRQNTSPGALFGAGLAYELSPSFDIRAEYRGFLVKTPDFHLTSGTGSFSTNRYEVISTPSIGIAFHF